MRRSTLILGPFLLTMSACADIRTTEVSPSQTDMLVTQPNTPPPFSTRKDFVITLHPSGFTLEIPAEWVVWYSQHGNNLHLSREELCTS